MKIVNVLIVLLMLTMNLAIGSTKIPSLGNEGGGGDSEEMRVESIRADILDWIEKEGAKALTLPKDLLYVDYVRKMKKILEKQAVVIGFGVEDQFINVEGTPKTCRGFISREDSRPHILCDLARFQKTSESDQYKLIHHEFAGLVGIEKNVGAASDYEISSQLTGFLARQVVLKLQVRPSSFSYAETNVCEKIYLNFNPDKKHEKKAAEDLLRFLEEMKQSGYQFNVQISHEGLYPHLDNSWANFESNAFVVSLDEETDFTGHEIKVEVYKTNHQKYIYFTGAQIVDARFNKAKVLLETAKSALIFSCGFLLIP